MSQSSQDNDRSHFELLHHDVVKLANAESHLSGETVTGY